MITITFKPIKSGQFDLELQIMIICILYDIHSNCNGFHCPHCPLLRINIYPGSEQGRDLPPDGGRPVQDGRGRDDGGVEVRVDSQDVGTAPRVQLEHHVHHDVH